MKLSTHFALEEFLRNSAGLLNVPPDDAIRRMSMLCNLTMEPIRALWGSTQWGMAININSGYRSAAVNAAVKGSPKSQHLIGEACDWVPMLTDGTLCRSQEVIKNLCGLITRQGIPYDQMIFYQSERPFVHISLKSSGNRKQRLWTPASGGAEGPYHSW